MQFQIKSLNYVPLRINNWNLISQELKNKYYVPDDAKGNTGTSTFDWNVENFGTLYTELERKLSRFEITVKRARFFYTKPGCELGPHVDGTGELGHYYWAINFPVHVPIDNHYHEWYSYDGEYVQNYTESYTDSTLLKDPNRKKLIDRLILDKPYLVKVGIPHAVYNHSDTVRLILSIRITKPQFIPNLIKSSIAEERFAISVHKNQNLDQ